MAKIKNIQGLRGIAVLAVVFFHLLAIENKYGGSKTLLPDFFQFGMFGVDLFFVISGFVMVTVTRGKFQNSKEAIRFIYHRVARIYPTYWFYTSLVLIVFLVNPSWVNSSQENQADILSSFLLLPSQTLPLLMVGWTLIHEMYFYIVFFVIFWLIPERYLTYTILLWAIGVVILNNQLELNSALIKIITHPLTIEFVGGCFLAQIYYTKSININKNISLTITALAFFAALFGYVLYYTNTGEIEPPGWWRVMLFGVPALFIVHNLVNAEKQGFIIHSSLIDIGNASYSIYLSHVLTLSAVGRIWGMFSTDRMLDNFIMVPVLLISVLMVGNISYSIVEKPLLRLSRKIA